MKNLKKTTDDFLKEMLEMARAGHEIYPAHFQPFRGTNACVGAAVRKAKKNGLLVEGGLDGVGKPFYVMPIAAIPAPTHSVTERVQ